VFFAAGVLKIPLWASPSPWFLCTTSDMLWHSSHVSLLQLRPGFVICSLATANLKQFARCRKVLAVKFVMAHNPGGWDFNGGSVSNSL